MTNLRKLLVKATPGPWRKSKGNLGNGIEGPTGKFLFKGDDGYRTVATYQAATASHLYKEQEENSKANCQLIIQAVNALPGLLDKVERYEAAIDESRALLSYLESLPHDEYWTPEIVDLVKEFLARSGK